LGYSEPLLEMLSTVVWGGRSTSLRVKSGDHGNPHSRSPGILPARGFVYLSSIRRVASASTGALSFVTLPASYSLQRSGCATPMVPDGLMVSSRKPSLQKPRPRCYPAPGLLHGRLRSALPLFRCL